MDEKATATEKVKFKIPPGTTEKRATGGEHDYRREEGEGQRRQDDSSHSPVSLYVGVATFRMLCAFSSSRGRHFTSPVSSRSSPFRASMNCICTERDGHVQRSSERRERDEKLQHRRGQRSQTQPACCVCQIFKYFLVFSVSDSHLDFCSGCKKTFIGFVSHFEDHSRINKQVLKPEIS